MGVKGIKGDPIITKTGLPHYDLFVAVVRRARLDQQKGNLEAKLFLEKLPEMAELFVPSTTINKRGQSVPQ